MRPGGLSIRCCNRTGRCTSMIPAPGGPPRRTPLPMGMDGTIPRRKNTPPSPPHSQVGTGILTAVWLKLKRFPAVLCAFTLFALNAAIVWPLFRVEYLRYFFSIEGTFIAISRAMVQRPHDLAWWPWWGTGLPFPDTYLPGVPATVALLCRLTGWSPALSYHAVTAFVYCLGPVAVFLLGWRLTAKVPAGFVAGLA